MGCRRGGCGDDTELLGDMPELLLEHVPAAVEARAHRTDRHAEDVRDLLIREIIDEIQRAYRAKLVRQLSERTRDVILGHARYYARRRIGVGTDRKSVV